MRTCSEAYCGAVYAIALWRAASITGASTIDAKQAGTTSVSTASRIRQDAYHTRYLDMAAFVKQHRRPGEVVMGSSELGWELGWHNNVIDDFRLGFLTGKRPDIVVLDKNRYQEWIPNLQVFNPAAYRFTTALLAREFEMAHRNEGYEVYLRKDGSFGQRVGQ